MTSYTREGIAYASGRLAAARRHYPDDDHSEERSALMEATAGYRLCEIRRRHPGVSLNEAQIRELMSVLR